MHDIWCRYQLKKKKKINVEASEQIEITDQINGARCITASKSFEICAVYSWVKSSTLHLPPHPSSERARIQTRENIDHSQEAKINHGEKIG